MTKTYKGIRYNVPAKDMKRFYHKAVRRANKVATREY